MTSTSAFATGRVARVIEQYGYCFVRVDGDETDIFLHAKQWRAEWPPPWQGRVKFRVIETPRGLRALDAAPITFEVV